MWLVCDVLLQLDHAYFTVHECSRLPVFFRQAKKERLAFLVVYAETQEETISWKPEIATSFLSSTTD
jgi:hypothetical protein